MIPGFPTIGGTELLILLAIILLFFGAKRIPQLARSLGRGAHEFRKGISAASSGEAQEEEDRKEKDEKKEPSPNATASRSDSPREEEAEKTTHAEQKS